MEITFNLLAVLKVASIICMSTFVLVILMVLLDGAVIKYTAKHSQVRRELYAADSKLDRILSSVGIGCAIAYLILSIIYILLT